jgi:hypothetical protein
VLVDEVSLLLFGSDLDVLRDPKNSLELGNISEEILNVILLDYLKKTTNTDR